MALSNKANTVNPTAGAVAGADVKGRKTDANEQIIKEGTAIIASMDDERKAKLGSLSQTLHFQHLLGLASKKGSRRVSATESVDCSTPVGLTLVSDVDIQVPVIDILKNKDTGIDPAADVTYRAVKAGEKFDISYYEFMFLILRDEYAGFCASEAGPKNVYFSPKLPAYFKGEAKLPTPTVNFKDGSIKASIIDIDEKGADGQWAVKANYADKFGKLLERKTPTRAAGNKSTVPTPTVVAVALQKILGIK